jgi:hypothetical protein
VYVFGFGGKVLSHTTNHRTAGTLREIPRG